MSGELTCSEAGRRGGQACLAKYGREHYQRIAAARHQDRAEQQRRAKAGGQATARLYGSEHYAAIGELGGQTVLRRYGQEYYARIARARREG